MYFVLMYENQTMKPVEIALRMGLIGINEKGQGESNMYCKHLC
jgi:hypothetical protein